MTAAAVWTFTQALVPRLAPPWAHPRQRNWAAQADTDRRSAPRHMPDEIFAVAAIPRTLSGRKMELPVNKRVLGASPDGVDWFVALTCTTRPLDRD